MIIYQHSHSYISFDWENALSLLFSLRQENVLFELGRRRSHMKEKKHLPTRFLLFQCSWRFERKLKCHALHWELYCIYCTLLIFFKTPVFSKSIMDTDVLYVSFPWCKQKIEKQATPPLLFCLHCLHTVVQFCYLWAEQQQETGKLVL